MQEKLPIYRNFVMFFLGHMVLFFCGARLYVAAGTALVPPALCRILYYHAKPRE